RGTFFRSALPASNRSPTDGRLAVKLFTTDEAPSLLSRRSNVVSILACSETMLIEASFVAVRRVQRRQIAITCVVMGTLDRVPGVASLLAKASSFGARPSLMTIGSVQGLLELFAQGVQHPRLCDPLSPDQESAINRRHIAPPTGTAEAAKGLGFGVLPALSPIDPDCFRSRRKPPPNAQQNDGEPNGDNTSPMVIRRLRRSENRDFRSRSHRFP